MYDTLGPDVSQYILNLTESPIVVCTHDKIQVLINLKKKYPQQTKNLISIVSMDPIDLVTQGTIEDAYELGITIQGLNQIEKLVPRIQFINWKLIQKLYLQFHLLQELQVVNQKE